MNEMYEKYLPVGTVVSLQGGTKKVLITGFVSVSEDTGDKIFDYSGCSYPEGFMSYDDVLVFDHSQIDDVVSLGYVDEDEIRFKKEMKIKLESLLNSDNDKNV